MVANTKAGSGGQGWFLSWVVPGSNFLIVVNEVTTALFVGAFL